MLSKKLITFVSAVLAMGLLVGCGGGGKPGSSSQQKTSDSPSTSTSTTTSTSSSSGGSTVKHTVTFYDGGAVYGDPVTVNDGATVARPATDPIKEGDEFVNYVFDNWYEAGATAAYNFATPVTEDLDLYSKYNEVAKEYDLVVYVYGVNGASTPTTYITEAESNRILQQFKGLDDVPEQTKILWHYVTGLTNTNFNKSVNESPIPVDLVISGAKLNNDDDVIECDATYGKVKVGEGWFENTTRYLAVTAACAAGHKDLAVKLYSMVKSVGPDYAITLSNNSLTLEIGASETITATYYGAAPTWELQNVDPAGCVTLEGSTVTAVAAGTAKLVATDAAGHTAECAITVSAAPVVPAHDLVVAFNISNASNSWMTEEDALALVTRFTSAGQPGEGKDVDLQIIHGVNIAGVVSRIDEIKANNELAKVDAALCRSAFFTNAACPTLLDGYTPVDVHSTWKYNAGQYGIFDDSFESHRELARAFGDFVSAQNVDYFEFDVTPITVKVGAQHQIETELTGLTYTSSDANVFTVSASGLIEGVAAGSGKLRVSKNAYYVEIGITVEEAVVEPVTLHIYINSEASKTTYMTAQNVSDFEAAIEAKVPETTTIVWHVISGKEDADNGGNNSKFAAYILGLTENIPDIIVGGSGAFGTDEGTIPVHSSMAKAKLTKYCATDQSRYYVGYANMPSNHVTAALQVYNAIAAL